MNKASNPLENRIQEHGQVSLLLTLALDPKTFDTSDWPVHLFLNHWLSAGIWGGLDAALKMGAATPGEASHLVALTFDDKDYPDWLPRTALAGPWCSRVIMPIMEASLTGKVGESEGIQLWPLGTEPPKLLLRHDTIRIALRGTPVGEPTVRHCEIEPGNWGFQAALSIKARNLDFRAFRLHPDREELQGELDAIAAAGDVKIFGMMDEGGGDEVRMDVMVEHWAPVAKKVG